MNHAQPCPQCQTLMVRASLYDPDGLIPLENGVHTEHDWWVCINPQCADGKANTRVPS